MQRKFISNHFHLLQYKVNHSVSFKDYLDVKVVLERNRMIRISRLA